MRVPESIEIHPIDVNEVTKVVQYRIKIIYAGSNDMSFVSTKNGEVLSWKRKENAFGFVDEINSLVEIIEATYDISTVGSIKIGEVDELVEMDEVDEEYVVRVLQDNPHAKRNRYK